MRLHRLRMDAFGPFAQETVIDFDALGSDGLFLLHGQTGAGKTTVLDAVAFALFGRVPGARQEGRRLHSDHAPAQQVPEVELEATIGGRRFAVVRSPEYQRPKKRGEGTTKVQARASLRWLDESGPALTRLPEIGEVITRLLGMSADQFFQVVLLPQGEFARFLRASSEEREDLLQRLFDTERFGGVEAWLKDRARVGAVSVTEKAAALARIAGQIAGAAGVEVPAEPEMDWAQGCLDDARAASQLTATALSAARAEFDAAQEALAEATNRTELRRRGEQATAKLAQLSAGDAALHEARQLLAAARSAAPVEPVADDHDAAVRAAERAERANSQAAVEFSALAEGAEVVDGDGDLDAAIERWTGESARWKPLAERVANRPRLQSDADRLVAEIAAADQRLAALTDKLAAAPARRETAAADYAAALDARTTLDRLATERDRLAGIAAALTDRETLSAQLAQAQQHAQTTSQSHLDAREHHLDLRERRIAGMAAELAESLTDGQPCAVCGAVEHPSPAVPDESGRVSDDAEKAAAQAEDAAARRRTAAQTELAALTERCTHLDEVIGENTIEQIGGEQAANTTELAAAQRRVRQIPALEKAIAALDAEAEAHRAEQARITADQSGRSERVRTLREQIEAIDTEVQEATGGRVGIAQRRAELAELCRRATVLRDARAEAGRTARYRDELAERLARRCAEAGFADVAAMRAAAATPEQILAWDQALSRAATLRAGAEQTLADADVAAALAGAPADIEALTARRAAAVGAHDAVARDHAIAAQRVTALETHLADFWSAESVLAPARDRQQQVQGLADLVSGRGQNSRRMSLHSYVLAARLEEVLVAASVRLRQMSSGRYEFVHSDSAGPRGRRGGLGIEVRDEYTGAVRAATTLSGGETFYASLALALGLADVVSAESGGRILDTIFIDEGFGTLDPEALDEVMGVLDELRSGGRVVGLVSHVDELRARIPAQLQVLRGENGSQVRMHEAIGVS